MAKAPLCLKDLRRIIKRDYSSGSVLECSNDIFKIQKIEGERRSAKRPMVRTQIPLAPSSNTEIVVILKLFI